MDTPRHPKVARLRTLLDAHFAAEEAAPTRAMVFVSSRPAVTEIMEGLRGLAPRVRAEVFVGQGAAKGARGQTQREQEGVLRAFHAGRVNALVCTCIGEEGIDVGEVDLIVQYDVVRSATRAIQRTGRTGRRRDGRVVDLVMRGGEEQDRLQAQRRQAELLRSLRAASGSAPLGARASGRAVGGRLQLYAHDAPLLPRRPRVVRQDVLSDPPALRSTAEKAAEKAAADKGGRRATDRAQAAPERGCRAPKGQAPRGASAQDRAWMRAAGYLADGAEGAPRPAPGPMRLDAWIGLQTLPSSTRLAEHSARSARMVRLLARMQGLAGCDGTQEQQLEAQWAGERGEGTRVDAVEDVEPEAEVVAQPRRRRGGRRASALESSSEEEGGAEHCSGDGVMPRGNVPAGAAGELGGFDGGGGSCGAGGGCSRSAAEGPGERVGPCAGGGEGQGNLPEIVEETDDEWQVAEGECGGQPSTAAVVPGNLCGQRAGLIQAAEAAASPRAAASKPTTAAPTEVEAESLAAIAASIQESAGRNAAMGGPARERKSEASAVIGLEVGLDQPSEDDSVARLLAADGVEVADASIIGACEAIMDDAAVANATRAEAGGIIVSADQSSHCMVKKIKVGLPDVAALAVSKIGERVHGPAPTHSGPQRRVCGVDAASEDQSSLRLPLWAAGEYEDDAFPAWFYALPPISPRKHDGDAAAELQNLCGSPHMDADADADVMIIEGSQEVECEVILGEAEATAGGSTADSSDYGCGAGQAPSGRGIDLETLFPTLPAQICAANEPDGKSATRLIQQGAARLEQYAGASVLAPAAPTARAAPSVLTAARISGSGCAEAAVPGSAGATETAAAAPLVARQRPVPTNLGESTNATAEHPAGGSGAIVQGGRTKPPSPTSSSPQHHSSAGSAPSLNSSGLAEVRRLTSPPSRKARGRGRVAPTFDLCQSSDEEADEGGGQPSASLGQCDCGQVSAPRADSCSAAHLRQEGALAGACAAVESSGQSFEWVPKQQKVSSPSSSLEQHDGLSGRLGTAILADECGASKRVLSSGLPRAEGLAPYASSLSNDGGGLSDGWHQERAVRG